MIRILFAIIVLALWSGISNADNWRDGSAAITCNPNEGFFELRSQQTYLLNEDSKPGEIVGQNVYFPAQLEEAPFVCKIPGYEIIVEGRNRIDGKGPCGVRDGAEARVMINGIPVAAEFESSNSSTTSISKLREGWIELSDCFERMHSVTLKSSSPSSISVELCRIEDIKSDETAEWIPVSGACKVWPRNSATFKPK